MTDNSPGSGYRVTQEGIEVTGHQDEHNTVHFDDQSVWSFDVAGRTHIPWPVAMKKWLDGVATVEIRSAEGTRLVEEMRFGTSLERIRFTDDQGIPVHIDKWGLVQHPFEGRGEEVVTSMVDTARRVIEVSREALGVSPWVAFGTLLGAVRSGGVIGHDSDIDLAYLSRSSDPAELAREMFRLSRALRGAGFHVVNKNASFITIMFAGPDGAMCSIDIYTCFHLGGLLHESATVRSPVPRSAIEPLGEIEFEGQTLPCPADPEALLVASYGEGWRVPDPGFRHRPGPDITDRFDDWFGSQMLSRREWERCHRAAPDTEMDLTSSLGRRAVAAGAPGAAFIDLGAGLGADSIAAARAGLRSVWVDYARAVHRRAQAVSEAEDLAITFRAINFYEHRDVLSGIGLIARTAPRPRLVLASGLLESLWPRGRDPFYRALGMLVRGDSVAFIDHATDVAAWQPGPRSGGRRFAMTTAEVERSLTRQGLVVREIVPVDDNPDGIRRVQLTIEGSRG